MKGRSHFERCHCSTGRKDFLRRFYEPNTNAKRISGRSCVESGLVPWADPERNLTRAQPKARGCGYMDVALSMGSYKHCIQLC